MQNFVLCYNSDCPLSASCLRFTHEPRTEWTAFHDFEPEYSVDREGLKIGRCDSYVAQGGKEEETQSNQKA